MANDLHLKPIDINFHNIKASSKFYSRPFIHLTVFDIVNGIDECIYIS